MLLKLVHKRDTHYLLGKGLKEEILEGDGT